MPRRKLEVAMDDVLDAMTMPADYSMTSLLDLQEGAVIHTGEAEVIGEEEFDEIASVLERDPERYEAIPSVDGHEEFRWMSRFAESVDEEDIRGKLCLALDGKGAFGRFRSVVRCYPDLDAKWHAMRQEELLKVALEWLESLEIEPIYELRVVEPVPSAAPPKHANRRLGLLDLLLLGAPGGKTELIDGQVLRQVTAHSPSEARGIFVNLARELCAFCGVEWRKRFVEGKSSFDMERTHLRLEGARVELTVEVTPQAWRAFE